MMSERTITAMLGTPEPILIQRGDRRVLLGGHPPREPCRVLAEMTYQEIMARLEASEDLLAACKAVIDCWHRAGLGGSHQLEKFEHCIRLTADAVAKAEGTT